MIFFSVLLPCHNETNLLDESINSILEQSFKDFELIIINDGSSNQKTLDIISKYKKHKNIIIVNNQKNMGLTLSLIKAAKYCSGRYIIRQDADDYSHVDRLKLTFNFLQKNQDTDLLLCSFYAHKNKKIYSPLVSYIYYLPTFLLLRMFPVFNIFVHGTFCISSNCIQSIGYNHNFKYSQDYKFSLDCLKQNKKINFLNQKLYFLNIQKDNLSTKFTKEQIFYDLLAKMNFFFNNNVDLNKNIFHKIVLYILAIFLVVIRRSLVPFSSLSLFK